MFWSRTSFFTWPISVWKKKIQSDLFTCMLLQYPFYVQSQRKNWNRLAMYMQVSWHMKMFYFCVVFCLLSLCADVRWDLERNMCLITSTWRPPDALEELQPQMRASAHSERTEWVNVSFHTGAARCVHYTHCLCWKNVNSACVFHSPASDRLHDLLQDV